ncbi:uncharacterized protein METZ01_LOCUS414269, partial [marine metagenome]
RRHDGRGDLRGERRLLRTAVQTDRLDL